MNDNDLKKLIKNSEVKTTYDFTDNLMTEIEKEASPKKPILLLPWRKIKVRFVVLTLISGILLYKASGFLLLNNRVVIPFACSLLLLLGLSYLISLNKSWSPLKA